MSAAPRPRGRTTPGRARRESRKARRARTGDILLRLKEEYPDARCALVSRSPFELLVATILSAQCTDKRVNAVTPALFTRFPAAADFAAAELGELEEIVRSTGFFRNKARSLKGLGQALCDRHQGVVPRTMGELTKLPGVGRKTAACVLIFSFDRPEIPVDTHVYRVGGRLGLFRENANLEEAHDEMLAITPPEDAYELHTNLIDHGRKVCRPKPRCGECALRRMCPYFRRNFARPT